MTFELFFDYLCPYVYRAGLWLERLKREGVALEPTWRFFPLVQINNKQEGWLAWEAPLAEPEGWQSNRRLAGLAAMWAAEAARQQGEEAFTRFHIALLRTFHEAESRPEMAAATREAAALAELDLPRWEQERRDPALLERIRRDYEAGAARGIFGTPTFLFPESEPAYLKLAEVPEGEEAARYWRQFESVVTARPLILEIKRPH